MKMKRRDFIKLPGLVALGTVARKLSLSALQVSEEHLLIESYDNAPKDKNAKSFLNAIPIETTTDFIKLVDFPRSSKAHWVSGAQGFLTIDQHSAALDDVYIRVSNGAVCLVNLHTFIGSDMRAGNKSFVVNDLVRPYRQVANLNEIWKDAHGRSLTDKYFNIVVWGIQNLAGPCYVMVNLPTGSYVEYSSALYDVYKYSTYHIPNNIQHVGFLIAEFVVRRSLADGGTWTLCCTKDLRG